jgi:uncharacterized protein YggT (Ycf19 family)
MLPLIRLVYFLFNVYAFGLVAYSVLSWVRGRGPEQARRRLEPLYLPSLEWLRRIIRPVRVGGRLIDLSPVLLLLAIVLVRNLIVVFLLGVTS